MYTKVIRLGYELRDQKTPEQKQTVMSCNKKRIKQMPQMKMHECPKRAGRNGKWKGWITGLCPEISSNTFLLTLI